MILVFDKVAAILCKMAITAIANEELVLKSNNLLMLTIKYIYVEELSLMKP